MKKFLLITTISCFAVAAAAGLSSCKKCTVCTADDGAGDQLIEEYCGDKSSVTNFENTWATDHVDSIWHPYCERGPGDRTLEN